MVKMRPVCHQSRCERDQINAKTAEALRRKGEKGMGNGEGNGEWRGEWGGLHRGDRVAENTERRGSHCRLCRES